jgi:L-amino acid N-acyltransferase YncA
VSATTAVIRPATPEDLDEVARIFAHYVTSSLTTFEETAPTVPDWRRRLDELDVRGLPFLVAEACGEVVGYAYASPWRAKPAYRHTAEDSIYLAPAWTGKGLGRALLDSLLTRCAAAGVRQVIAVIADTGEEASAALHRACGFAEVGRLGRVGYKHGRWLDTVLMQRDLAGRSGGGTPAGGRAAAHTCEVAGRFRGG